MRPLIVGIAFLGIAAVCSAQSSSSSSSNSGSGQQDTSQPQAASAQGGQTAAQPGATPAPADKKKPKKVWTNDELGTAKGVASNSAGTASSPASSSSDTYKPPTNYEVLLRTYVDKLRPLRSDLADLDRKIQQAKEAKGNAREDTAAWIAVQQKKRQDVLAKIQRLEDEAEHKGVLPGDLRD